MYQSLALWACFLAYLRNTSPLETYILLYLLLRIVKFCVTWVTWAVLFILYYSIGYGRKQAFSCYCLILHPDLSKLVASGSFILSHFCAFSFMQISLSQWSPTRYFISFDMLFNITIWWKWISLLKQELM